MQDSIADLLSVVTGNIADVETLKEKQIDAIVNAAKPTLMGSSQGVDGEVHRTIDSLIPGDETFNQKIGIELGSKEDENSIRCKRGKALLTSGYGLCKYVIHVVGAQHDGSKQKRKNCSSSRIRILESCYYQIVEQLKQRTDIRNIAIPIISSGEYEFPYDFALKIAIASIGNALIEWKMQDSELFEMAGIEQIYFFIYDSNSDEETKKYQYAEEILREYKPIFQKNRKVVFQSSYGAHCSYLLEIMKYDEYRGYFSVAWVGRLLLLLSRIIFVPTMILKDIIGGKDWIKRRQFVEFFAFVKMLVPIFFWYLLSNKFVIDHPVISDRIFPVIVIYGMCDTVTYLLTLIVMADIQRPSANIIRSMIMLLVNYLEVSFAVAYLYYIHYRCELLFREAVAFGVLGEKAQVAVEQITEYAFLYLNTGLKFFFTSLVFGYFVNHMRQRKFKS